ncbi:MAG: hypothetical protein E2P02_11410 [Acidobacteria bacterium]|nr:MAG: hypothetical protein E2P02_11410 [Acidobacteriota bacterium]
MVELNHSERTMRAKIVYYGPATGGKTTNLQVIHRRAKREKGFDLFSIDTAQNRTILFDLLPMSTPAFQNYQLRFQLIGVPGQKLYAVTRKMLLKNADAVVFVANSATDRWNESLESFKEMIGFLEGHGLDPATIPTVLQYNKQDLGDIVDLQAMEEAMNPRHAPYFLAVANQEKGVLETFAGALRATVSDLARRYGMGKELSHAQNIEEWAEQTMLFTFGVLKFDDDGDYVSAEPTKSGASSSAPEPAAKVVKVRTPSKKPAPAKAQTVETPISSEPARTNPPPLQANSATEAQPAPAVATATAVDDNLLWATVSAADEVQDAFSAQAMVESYAEAAVGLADHISDLRDQKDSVSRRAADFVVVSDTMKTLAYDATADAHGLLEQMLRDLAANWEAAHAALYISRPDGTLDPVIRHALEIDPFKSAIEPNAPSEGVAILDAGGRVVQMRGEEGLLEKPIKRVGLECVGAAAYPLFTPIRRVGLLTLWFLQGAAALSLAEAEHLDKVAFELSLGMHVVSDVRGASWKL